jgi:WD40 repeat protein
VASLQGHAGVVRACQFSPNGCFIATCSWDKTIRLWYTHNFQLASLLQGHKYGVTDCTFSPSGDLLASSSWDNTVGLWDVATGQLVQQLTGHTSAVSACSFGVGGSLLATSSWDGTVRVWDLSQASPAITLTGHNEAVYDVVCSPVEPGILASCGRKGMIAVWDARSQAAVQSLQRVCQETNCVSFSPSGSQLACGNDLCQVELWDWEAVKNSSFRSVTPKVLEGHSGVVYGVNYSTNGAYLASCSADRTCKLWTFTPSQAVTDLAHDLASMLSIDGGH